MDKIKPLMPTQRYWSWQQPPTFREHTVHVNTEFIMHSVSTQLPTFWVPSTMSMASWVRSHWAGVLWIAHTRLRASPKTGHTNILPFPTPNSFQLLCWKTWNISSHHSNLLRMHRNLSWRATYNEENIFFSSFSLILGFLLFFVFLVKAKLLTHFMKPCRRL